MTFVIDDPETIRLLRELAELTGETMEQAAIVSVEQKLQILRGEKTSEQVAAEDWQRVVAHRHRTSEASAGKSETPPREAEGE